MARVTQRVDPAELDELLERAPRAALAFVDGAQIEALPVAYRREAGRHLVGVARGLWPAAAPGRAVLLVDDGRYWFELRAVTHRGRLVAAPTPASTGQATLAARNTKAYPEIVVLLDGEARGRRGRVLRLRGTAAVHGELPSWRVLARFALKYYLGGAASELRHARQWGLRQRYYGQGEIAVIDFVPERAEWLGDAREEGKAR